MRRMRRTARPLTLCVLAAVAAGCAGPGGGSTAALAPGSLPGSAAGYQLTEEERGLDCKKLTGRMQVRILQVRDFEARERTSFVARGLQTATTSVLGGSKEGADPDGQYQRSRAQLAAYNQLLASKGCRTFDLESELKPKPITETPTPVAPREAEPSEPSSKSSLKRKAAAPAAAPPAGSAAAP